VAGQQLDVDDATQLGYVNLERDAFVQAVKDMEGVTQITLVDLLARTKVGQPAKGYSGPIPRNKALVVGFLLDSASGTL
jgi:hypothetical protein